MNRNMSKKKVKNLRNVTMLLLICVLMLSAASYAWFTTSKSASLSDLNMTVTSGAGGGLLFATLYDDNGTTKQTDYTNTLNLSNIITVSSGGLEYSPATAANALTTTNAENSLYNAKYAQKLQMFKPKYDATGLVVDDVESLSSCKDGSTSLYYYEATFMVKIPDGEGMKTIYLTDNDAENGTGTFVSATGEGQNTAVEAIRVAFTIYDAGVAKTKIYEYQGVDKDLTPQAGFAAGENEANLGNYGIYTGSTIIQNQGGTFEGEGDTKSDLFQMTAGVDVPMTVQVWFEGRDPQCNNIISGKGIQGRFGFEVK